MDMLTSEDYSEKNDSELVALSLRKSDFFGILVGRYEQKFLNYIQRISGSSKEEAEDIMQEAFIKIYQNLADFDSTLKFSSWAYRIVHNETISHWRKNQSRHQQIFSNIGWDTVEQIKSAINLEQEIDQHLLIEKINQALQKMNEKYREVIILSLLEQKSYDEISDILQKPIGTIGTLINRAKKQLSQYLKYD